ncbi:hypothetical protein BGHDH14_bgh01383 [Blumeria hordei DH14]|uniref:MARVEL domain-containing protein n=1 Tax=Blumeria graminis f. sp. hordei (strain DH14) TaxID=546991 RepID=N1JK73_BLUG1|nr:hypothetical protein BGHDH14_bgh01383 [Blumeria hordei DH14]
MNFIDRYKGPVAYFAHAFYRFIQLTLALTVCGLYGMDLSSADQANESLDGRWIYAVVTAGLAVMIALAYLVPLSLRIPFVFVIDTVIFILWIVVFGIFGNIFIKAEVGNDPGWKKTQRMKNSVWVDLANAVSWLISAAGMGIYWATRKRRSLFTGRAIV